MDYVGNVGLNLQSDVTTKHQNGSSRTQIWEGPRDLVRSALVNPVYTGGSVSAVAQQTNGPYAQLIIQWEGLNGPDGGDDLLATLWELVPNYFEKSIYNHPKALELETAHPSWLRKIEKNVDAYLDSDPTAPYEFPSELQYSAAASAINPPSTLDDNAEELAKAILRGVSAMQEDAYVLRNVRMVPPTSSLKPIYIGKGDWYTNDALALHVVTYYNDAIPTNLLGTLPDGYWQKRAPTVSQASNGAWQLVQEWWFADDFDRFLYKEAAA